MPIADVDNKISKINPNDYSVISYCYLNDCKVHVYATGQHSLDLNSDDDFDPNTTPSSHSLSPETMIDDTPNNPLVGLLRSVYTWLPSQGDNSRTEFHFGMVGKNSCLMSETASSIGIPHQGAMGNSPALNFTNSNYPNYILCAQVACVVVASAARKLQRHPDSLNIAQGVTELLKHIEPENIGFVAEAVSVCAMDSIQETLKKYRLLNKVKVVFPNIEKEQYLIELEPLVDLKRGQARDLIKASVVINEIAIKAYEQAHPRNLDNVMQRLFNGDVIIKDVEKLLAEVRTILGPIFSKVADEVYPS